MQDLDSVPLLEETLKSATLMHKLKTKKQEELISKEQELKSKLSLLETKYQTAQQLVNQTFQEKKAKEELLLIQTEQGIQEDEKKLLELTKEVKELPNALKKLEQENQELNLVFEEIKGYFGVEE